MVSVYDNICQIFQVSECSSWKSLKNTFPEVKEPGENQSFSFLRLVVIWIDFFSGIFRINMI